MHIIYCLVNQYWNLNKPIKDVFSGNKWQDLKTMTEKIHLKNLQIQRFLTAWFAIVIFHDQNLIFIEFNFS